MGEGSYDGEFTMLQFIVADRARISLIGWGALAGALALLCALPGLSQAQMADRVADADGNGLIEIDSLADLHNMRYDMAGTSYKTSTTSVGNSSGCPEEEDGGCYGYELMQNLDFDGDGDGRTWSGDSEAGYTLDEDDNQDNYFPVTSGGWLPIGDTTDTFVAVFDGNGHSIRNLAIRRNQESIGLFGAIGDGAAIRDLGLIDNLVDYTGSGNGSKFIGGLVGWQGAGEIRASYATGVVDGGDGDTDRVGGLVGWQEAGEIRASYATGTANGGDGAADGVGGLVGWQDSGLITVSYATGAVDGGNGRNDYVGGLVGFQNGGSITASSATGAAEGGDGGIDYVGGLVGQQQGSITASYATGAADGGNGVNDYAGGLVGYQFRSSITASYATGAADGGNGNDDYAGGLVGWQLLASITASYATGAANGGNGDDDYVGGLVGRPGFRGLITKSYGFGEAVGELSGSAGSAQPEGISRAAQLTAANAGSAWNDAGSNTRGAWDFGADSQIPALNYADYDGDGPAFTCDYFPVGACGTLLPGQEGVIASGPLAPLLDETVILTVALRGLTIASWNWQQLAGTTVSPRGADTATPTFTMPDTRSPLVFELTATATDGKEYSTRITIAATADADVDQNGLIEIYSLVDLHNMRYNLAGTSYVGNSQGCPESGCRGYELMQNLDFDLDDDGRTWSRLGSGNGEASYTLGPGDSQADYFPVDGGAGGWLPIGDQNDPFVTVFAGNGHSIGNLAIRRNLTYIGLFGVIGDGAAIRSLGLIDNLAEYTGTNDDANFIGGLVGSQDGGLITASYATGTAAGGGGDSDRVGGLVGFQAGGLITASYATGAAAGGGGDSDRVGGLVGSQDDGLITASYATGAAHGGGGNSDRVGGLVGQQQGGSITASYARGAVDGGGGNSDRVGGLVGWQSGGSITASYGFGAVAGEISGHNGSAKPEGVSIAAQLTAANAGSSWNDAGSNTLGAWDFGTDRELPALNYADYDGLGAVFNCDQFPVDACGPLGILLPGQEGVNIDELVPGVMLVLALAAGGDPLFLRRIVADPAVEEGFDPNILEYRAGVPLDSLQVFFRATSTVIQELMVDGMLVQNRAEVRLFRRVEDGDEALEDGDDVAGLGDIAVELPEAEDEFVFVAQVLVPHLVTEMDEETTYQTYTLPLRLTRALPAEAELVIFLASAGERRMPLTATTPLLFGPDEDARELVLVVRDGLGNSYGIEAVSLVGLVAADRLIVEVGDQAETEGVGLATPVTLRRGRALTADTFTFPLTLTATPERPLAADAEELSVDIAGTLFDNSVTETQFRATYRGQDQERELPIFPEAELRVSATGTLTIALRVERSGGGLRSFEQSSFTLSVTSNDTSTDDTRVNLDGNILRIAVGANLDIEIAAVGDEILGDKIAAPPPLSFSVFFEKKPRAFIRAVAARDSPSPNPLFAFVGEEERLPLEVVLAVDSVVPLADSDSILRALSLAVTSRPAELAPTVVTLEEPSDPGASPSRVLLFAVAAAQNGVSFTVAVDALVEGQSELVNVVALNFGAHFLSLEHGDEVGFPEVEEEGFVPDFELVEIVLRGEAAGVEAEIWTLAVANAVELEDDGYEVAEVVYSVEPPADAVTRTLRIRRLRSDAENSRLVLNFTYTPPAGMGEAGEFNRIIGLETGVVAELKVEVHPETLVIPRGGMANVTLVISNLPLDADPSEFIRLSHSSDLQIRSQDGELDAINRRFEQVLEIRALEGGVEPDSEVQVEVRLPGGAPGRTLGRARFSVDINDPPRYEGEELLMVLESGEEQEYLLTNRRSRRRHEVPEGDGTGFGSCLLRQRHPRSRLEPQERLL